LEGILGTLTVKPGDFEIQRDLVALWDMDDLHLQADPAWETFGGAYIAGDHTQPDKTYTVADTPEVRVAAKQGRIVIVEKVVEKPAEPPSGEQKDGEQPPAGDEQPSDDVSPNGETRSTAGQSDEQGEQPDGQQPAGDEQPPATAKKKGK
jgi:hypothetical protein